MVAGLKFYIMIRTIVNSPFLAFYDYDEPNERLVVYLKTGQQILVDKFGRAAYSRLNRERNKGSYIFHHILDNPIYDKWEGDRISRYMIEKIIVESTNQKPQVYRWLSS